MTRKSYVNISIPKTLVDEMDQIINKKIGGYSSRAEFMKDAARHLLEKLKNQ